jgi:hypothetical protein
MSRPDPGTLPQLVQVGLGQYESWPWYITSVGSGRSWPVCVLALLQYPSWCMQVLVSMSPGPGTLPQLVQVGLVQYGS